MVYSMFEEGKQYNTRLFFFGDEGKTRKFCQGNGTTPDRHAQADTRKNSIAVNR